MTCYFSPCLSFLASSEFEYKQLFVIELKFHYKVAAIRNTKQPAEGLQRAMPTQSWVEISQLQLYLEMQFRN